MPLRDLVISSALAFVALPLVAQGDRPVDPPGPVPGELLDTFEWRELGPFRGGRSSAVTGITADRSTYYFGGSGGGVWKTTDAGATWKNVSDGTFGGSIGAIAVAPSNNDILYVGGGESTWRGNMSSGDGIYKSTDAGATWHYCGLPESRHIARIRIHPQDPDLVYAAVMGHVSGPNAERGVYRSKDGGGSWQRVLFANEYAGAFELCMAADDPNVLYATTWRAIRTPHSLESGGEGSGLWQSTDGGDTWQSLHDRPGMPDGLLGISGIAVAPSNSKIVYAQIENDNGGLFRSDDAGATWKKVNDERKLRQRAWYYSRVFVDPKNPQTVYGLNVGCHRSTDGGATFSGIATPHGDNHDLWIDPQDPLRMIEGNDGGACITTDGGKTWSSLGNQPTAQFYRVAVDDDAPYRIYGAQQDNSTVRIVHRSRGPGIGADDWEPTAGGESGWLAPRPGNSDIVFGGSYGGYLQRRDHRTGLSRSVNVWPDNPLGAGAGEQRYRFQWNFPIQWSRHHEGVLYTAAQVLFESRDEGASWQPLSGDLTRDDKERQVSSGGPITKDNTGVEYYCTIFAFDEGRRPGTLWCGSDDGLIHVSRDGGERWQNVTPPMMPEWAQVNCIAHDPFRDGGCYVAATRYKLDDFRPYLYATDDYGASWREITGGLDPKWFTRAIRPDPVVKGLLYCGTERTVWVSFNDGRRWQRLQRNLPPVPITDLVVKDGALIAATQGRSFWSFDGLDHVRQLHADQAQRDLHLFTPVALVQYPGGDEARSGLGRNPDKNLHVRFWLGGDPEAAIEERVAVVVKDIDGKVVFERSTDAETAEAGKETDAGDGEKVGAEDDGEPKAAVAQKLAVKRGMNVVEVEWKEERAKVLDGMILWSGRGGAPKIPPGDYEITVTLGEVAQTVTAVIRPDPRTTASTEELQERYRLACRCRDTVTRAHDAIATIRSLRSQMQAVVDRSDGEAKARLEVEMKAVDAELTAVEETLYQTKAKSSQDVLNFPIRLTDKLLNVLGGMNRAEFGPTQGQREVANALMEAIDSELAKFGTAREDGVAKFNALARELAVPYVK
ncbi:MAG: glycosyl hydrolase [Planctomycetes bacterium]|nr:glycosyl hydrolase [Planctomycetota bacterium]